MDKPARIGLIGDRDPAVTAHRAIPLALELARQATAAPIDWTWVETPELVGEMGPELAGFAGLWCVPASPYRNTAGAIRAIRHARESGLPYLGTCAGFQHALLEYAEAVWKIESPAHAELDPEAEDPIIAPLSCSMVEKRGSIHLVPGTRLARFYGSEHADEGYHCSYGFSPTHAHRLEHGPLRVAARDDAGEVRAVELDGHPFFFCTLYQPERAALEGRSHPLIEAFVQSIATARD
jgi:CTP synthase (UTP-ammonia lyase)